MYILGDVRFGKYRVSEMLNFRQNVQAYYKFHSHTNLVEKLLNKYKVVFFLHLKWIRLWNIMYDLSYNLIKCVWGYETHIFFIFFYNCMSDFGYYD